jgi:maltooligosyltrehalose trehalohydrolase
LLRFFQEDGDDRLLVVNFGHDLAFDPAPEPLLAPPAGQLWRVLWCSEDPAYGGSGARPPESDGRWTIQGHAATVMMPEDGPRASSSAYDAG